MQPDDGYTEVAETCSWAVQNILSVVYLTVSVLYFLDNTLKFESAVTI
jgi:hypothetical protein